MSTNSKHINNLKFLSKDSDPSIRNTKSTRKPSALSEAPCMDQTKQKPKEQLVQLYLKKLKSHSLQLYTIALLQFVNGLRISEVLRIKHHHISPQGFIRIKALKGSSGRMVHAGESMEFFHRCRMAMVDPFVGISRFYVYREYKKLGIQGHFGNSQKNSVTHFFRHNASQQATAVNADLETRSHQLGHKSTKSTEHYGKKSKHHRDQKGNTIK